MLAVIISARYTGMDARPTIAAIRAQSDAPIYVAGQLGDAIAYEGVVAIDDDNPTRARNKAIAHCTADIVCLTDADCVPAAGWLDALLAPFADPALVGVKGVYATRQKSGVAQLVQAEYERKYRRLAQQNRIDFIDTYSAAYRRDVLLANEGFDEQFPYLEDQELSFRLAARGYRLGFQPAAIVYRDHADTGRAYFRKKFNIGYWKAHVVRRFPTQGVTDSHTPPVLKVQVGLAAVLLLALAVAPFWAMGWWAAVAVLGTFVGTTLPFARWTWKQRKEVAIRAPGLLLVRALGLGFGYVWGSVRPQPLPQTHTTISGIDYVFKRLLDIVGGLVGCTLLAAVLPFVGVAIKVGSPGAIFFRQERIGQRGRPFYVYKFRSMVADAEAQLDDLIDIEQLDEPAFKLENDPRVTKIGRWLRRWSIDELPQFWNVLKGEMSLVGPRPEETRMVAQYNAWQRRRLTVKPGITGPMQVNGRGDLSLNERVQLEIDYIENYTIGRDVAILWQTFPAVLGGEGAR